MTDPVLRSVATTTSSTGNSSTSATGNLASTTSGYLNILILNVTSATTTDPGVPTLNGIAVSTSPGSTNSAGWTTLFTRADTSATANMPRVTVVARIRQSSDSESIVAWAWANASNHVAGSVAYQTGTFNATSISTAIPDISSQEQTSSATSFPTPTLSTTARGLLLTIGGNRTSGTWTAPAGDTIRTSEYSSSSANFFASDSGTATDTGSYSKTATFSAATSVGVMSLINVASYTGTTTVSSGGTVAFRASASNSGNSTTPSITVPSSCHVGDVLIMQLSLNDTDVYTSAPAGVTVIDTDTSTNSQFPNRLFRATVDGSTVIAGTALSWGTLSSTRTWEVILYAASGVDTTNPILAYTHSGVGNTSGTAVTIPSLTTSGTSWLLEIGSAKSNPGPITTWTTASGWMIRQQLASYQTYAGSSFIADSTGGMAAPGTYGGDSYTADQSFNERVAYIVALQAGSSNVAPTANAGSDQADVEPYDTVTLDGSVSSDPDGSVSGYAWSQTSGTAVNLSSTSIQKPTFVAPATINGISLVFSLVVTDNSGMTSTSGAVTITVLPHTIWRLDAGSPTPMQIINL